MYDNNRRDRPANDHGGLLKAALAGGGLFLLWRAGRAVGTALWAVFGIGIAIAWSGAWRFMVP